jgi:ribosomal protein S9
LKLVENGTGIMRFESPTEGVFDIDYFHDLIHRDQLLFPFKVVDRINRFDCFFQVNEAGMSCIAKACRYAISRGLCSFQTIEEIEKLRLGY